MFPKKSTKRPHFESSDSEPEIIYQNTPTYMVIQSTEDIPITKISPFKIEQILSKKIKPKTTKKLTNGTILIEVQKTQVEEILRWETFNNIKIKTSLHQTLNSSKGVVKSSELSLCTLDEIKTNLKNQNVIDIKRISIKKNGETINTNTYILNFNIPKPPNEINVGYIKIKVETCIPNPLRCFNCQKFGHHQDRCTRPPVCGRCGENNARHTDCQKEAKCTNCKKNHPANSRDCEIWKKEKDISKIKYTQNITFPEARKLINTVTYTEISKRHIPNPNQQGHQTYENNQPITKPEVVTQLMNEMRTLIQEMKTIIKTITENKQLSKENSNTKTSTNQETQAKPNKENPKVLSSEVASTTRPSQTSPNRETIKKKTLMGRSIKIDQDQPQEQELPQK